MLSAPLAEELTGTSAAVAQSSLDTLAARGVKMLKKYLIL